MPEEYADHVSGRRPAPASNGTAPRAARSAVRRSRLAVTDRTASALDPAVYSIGPSTTAQSGATSCRASARTDSNGLPPLFIAHLNRPTPCVDRGEHVSRGGQDGTSVRPVREPDPANSRTSSNLSAPVISSSLATIGYGRASTSLPCFPCSARAARTRTRTLAESRNDSPDASTVTSRAPVSSCAASISRSTVAVVGSASPDSTTTGPSAPANAETLSAAMGITLMPYARGPSCPAGGEGPTPAGNAKPPAVPSTSG